MAILSQVLLAAAAQTYPTRAKTLSSWGSKGTSTLKEVWKSGVSVAGEWEDFATNGAEEGEHSAQPTHTHTAHPVPLTNTGSSSPAARQTHTALQPQEL